MTEHSVLNSTFTLERTYPTSPRRVFAAWADPAAKARWFVDASGEHTLDFRVHGRETVVRQGEPVLRLESVYQDIVPDARIVYTSTLYSDERLATVSLTTVRFSASEDGTDLILTEQGTFLDGMEPLDWRKKGTENWLNALAEELDRTD